MSTHACSIGSASSSERMACNILSSDGRVQDFLKTFSMNGRTFDFDLASFLAVNWNQLELKILSKFAPISCLPAQLSTDSWSRHCFQELTSKQILTWWNPACCCCKLLNSGNLLDPLWWIIVASSWRGNLLWLSGRLIGVLLVHVTVEVGLVTGVRSRIGHAAKHSTPMSGSTGVQLYFYPKMLRTHWVLTLSKQKRTWHEWTYQEDNRTHGTQANTNSILGITVKNRVRIAGNQTMWPKKRERGFNQNWHLFGLSGVCVFWPLRRQDEPRWRELDQT